MNLKQKIDYSVNLIKKAERLALQYDPSNGFYLAFSGGKDSQVIYELAKMAGVKFQAHMNLTSVDPPQVVKFVRKHYPDVQLHRPKESIYKLIPKKKCLPSRLIRWCCDVLKEQSGAGTVTILGIRKAESLRRSKRNEIETGKNNFSGSLDQFDTHNETQVSCIKGIDKILLSPILDWSERDVWDFLKLRNLPHCELYDLGYRRIGCIMCPMAGKKEIARDRLMFPKVEKAYKKAIKNLLASNPKYGSKLNNDENLIFEWWASRQKQNVFIALNLQQYKINFD
ncbi:phosphoadenosine phosphosulfate reductase [Dysgonomonas alginatilytica]|uniref:Phosphoadenosine phosphosulfate reductase n=1 Tax=Dysgonomonas alginatilytica TaxID=1605892 RepID=A0A2V3PNK2_9BACT|nr:phosphoadenosine phosphosulfate reductase family protein [Dysgonomonas alginatilytica]PXV62368.1 phosphoadenosine phosphosulfate reductase [Dysgonomonas alginatilytica]